MNKDITKIDDDEQADKAGVERFAAAMLKKLSLKRCEGRGGWNDPYTCTTWKLREMLIDHMRKGDPVDIANFCMMIWNRENPTAEAAHPEDTIARDAARYRYWREAHAQGMRPFLPEIGQGRLTSRTLWTHLVYGDIHNDDWMKSTPAERRKLIDEALDARLPQHGDSK